MSKTLKLVYGDENYLIDEAIDKLRKKIVPAGQESFAYQFIDGQRTTVTEIVNALQTLPVFTPEKLIIIRNPFFLTSKKRAKSDDAEADSASSAMSENDEMLLSNTLQNIPEGLIVVLAVYGNVDMRRKLAQFLKKNAEVLEYHPFASWEQDKLVQWIKNNFNTQGYQIAPGAIEILLVTAGTNLQALNNEIAKIITYVGSKKNIQADDIKAVTSQGELAAFELQDALNGRQIAKALNVIGRMVREGAHPVMIMGMLVGQIRVMLQIKELAQHNSNHYDIAKQLKKNPFYIKKLLSGSQKYTYEQLKNFYYELQTTDMKIKTGQMEPKLAVEYVVSSLV